MPCCLFEMPATKEHFRGLPTSRARTPATTSQFSFLKSKPVTVFIARSPFACPAAIRGTWTGWLRLTMDMQIVDVAWIGMKLRKLVDYDEPMGSFFAKVPGTGATERFPSIVAYLARLIIHRYAQLGLLTSAGFPVVEMGVMVEVPGDTSNVLPVAA